mgnify:CR=1 FL=1
MPQMNIIPNPKSTIVKQDSIADGLKNYLDTIGKIDQMKLFETQRAMSIKDDEEKRRHNMVLENLTARSNESQAAERLIQQENAIWAQVKSNAQIEMDQTTTALEGMQTSPEAIKAKRNEIQEKWNEWGRTQINTQRGVHKKFMPSVDLGEITTPLYPKEEYIAPKVIPLDWKERVKEDLSIVKPNLNKAQALVYGHEQALKYNATTEELIEIQDYASDMYANWKPALGLWETLRSGPEYLHAAIGSLTGGGLGAKNPQAMWADAANSRLAGFQHFFGADPNTPLLPRKEK